MKILIKRSVIILPAIALFASAPAMSASETSARVESAASEIKGDAAKAALKEIDNEIDFLDDAVDNAPTAAEKSAARARLDTLKERRGELRKTYAKSRFDELKADVRAESNRIGAWSKKTFKRDPVATTNAEINEATREAKRDMDRAGNKVHASATAAAASMDLDDYKRRSTNLDKNEAKAAVQALDRRIDELADRADNMPKGADRDVAKRRIQALEDRKDELESDFNKERFNALVDEVQGMAKDLR